MVYLDLWLRWSVPLPLSSVPALTAHLTGYQRRAVAWMLAREQGVESAATEPRPLHVLWRELTVPGANPSTIYFNSHTGKLVTSTHTYVHVHMLYMHVLYMFNINVHSDIASYIKNHNSQGYERPSVLDVKQSPPMHRTCFSQCQASSATLGRPDQPLKQRS